MPLAASVKVALAGAVTVTLSGWVVMLGFTAIAATVNVAALLVTEPAWLVTTHLYCVVSLAKIVAAVV